MPTYPGKRYPFTEQGFSMLSKDLMYYLNNLDDENVSLVTASSNYFQLGTSNVLADKRVIFYDNSTNDVMINMTSDADLIVQTHRELFLKGTTVNIDTTGGLYLSGSTVNLDCHDDLNLNSSALNIKASSITIDSTNNITINSSGLNITPSSFNLTAEKDINFNSSAFSIKASSISIDSTNDITINSSGLNITPSSFNLTAEKDINFNSSAFSIKASSISIDSTNDITINSSGLNITPSSFNLTAEKDINFNSSNINVYNSSYMRIGANQSTGYTEFEKDGTIVFYGNARTFRDELGDVTGFRSVGPGVSDNQTELTKDFSSDADLNDYLYTNVQLNHDRDLAANIHPHIHFFQNSSNTPNLVLSVRWQVNGGVKTDAWTYYKCNSLVFPYVTGSTMHQIADTTGIAVPVGSIISDIVQFRIIRDSNNGSSAFATTDPSTGIISVLSFDVHIESNTIGSRTEYSK